MVFICILSLNRVRTRGGRQKRGGVLTRGGGRQGSSVVEVTELASVPAEALALGRGRVNVRGRARGRGCARGRVRSATASKRPSTVDGYLFILTTHCYV